MSMKLPSEYNKLLSSSYDRFHYILSEMSKTYPNHKLNPNNTQYSTEYQQDLSNLHDIKGDIRNSFLDLQTDSDTIKNYIENKNDEIEKLNKKNQQLRDYLIKLENSDNAAGGELSMKNHVYNVNLTQNIILLSIIFGGVFFTIKK